MACLTPVTIRIDTPTGPLNSAVYEPTRDKIFAVRDNWIYQLNATTGAREAESRFAYPGISNDSYIDYDTTTDKLWATYGRSTYDGAATLAAQRYLVEIDPDDITSVILHPLTGLLAFSGGFSFWEHNPSFIITRSGIAWVTFTNADNFRTGVARIDLSTLTLTHNNTSMVDSLTWGGLYHDGTNLFHCGNEVLGNDAGFNNPANLAGVGDVGNTNQFLYAITKPGNFCYMATASQIVVKGEVGGGLTASEIDLGRPNANPHNIRFVIPLNLIYIPLYKDDTVAVLNPFDDSFEIKTGFTAPWDVVNTGSKVFALQHAAIGIKEIT